MSPLKAPFPTTVLRFHSLALLYVILLSNQTITTSATSTLTPTSWLESISLRLLLRSPKTPDKLCNMVFTMLGVTIAALRSTKFLAAAKNNKTNSSNDDNDNDDKNSKSKQQKLDAVIRSIQKQYLPVFWLLCLSFWMSGPYFHQVYSSKTFNREPVTLSLISRIFLAGFGSIALFGPGISCLLDIHNGRKGTLAACVVYALGVLSTMSNLLPILFVERAVGGLGTNLLSSTPEPLLVREANRHMCPTDKDKEDDKLPSRCIRETFRRAYIFDSLVGIASGQIGGYVARRNSPMGPFLLLPAFLFAGSVIVLFFWDKNNAASPSIACAKQKKSKETPEKGGLTNRNRIKEKWKDKKFLALGAVQSLFKGSMCIFVSQWPPAVSRAVAHKFGNNVLVPYGTVFSCFMACCMLGSTLLNVNISAGLHTYSLLEIRAMKMFTISALSIVCTMHASAIDNRLYLLVLGMFSYKACVGMHFPVMGMMRSRYLPMLHQSVIMSIYSVLFNMLVVSIFLYIGRLRVTGAFAVATVALVTVVLCMVAL